MVNDYDMKFTESTNANVDKVIAVLLVSGVARPLARLIVGLTSGRYLTSKIKFVDTGYTNNILIKNGKSFDSIKHYSELMESTNINSSPDVMVRRTHIDAYGSFRYLFIVESQLFSGKLDGICCDTSTFYSKIQDKIGMIDMLKSIWSDNFPV